MPWAAHPCQKFGEVTPPPAGIDYQATVSFMTCFELKLLHFIQLLSNFDNLNNLFCNTYNVNLVDLGL